jgi:D-alanine-D-alanine ligase
MPKHVRRILHLVGSPTSPFHRELSHLYAADCLTATADATRYEFHVADVAPDGHWRFPSDLTDDALNAAEPIALSAAIERIELLGIDVVVPQMFCIPGMTTYRALFELLGIPYIGNTAQLMATTADKALARSVIAQTDVSVPEGQVLRRNDMVVGDTVVGDTVVGDTVVGDTVVGSVVKINLPVVVKPVDADNSLGVTLVTNASELPNALEIAWLHSERAIIERFVELGREVRCATVMLHGELVCLPLEEYAVDAVTQPIRDHADKLARDPDGDLRLVAKESTRAWIVDTDDPITARVWEAALRCHAALGCRHYGLFDFRVDSNGEPWFLEASLYNSFARTSVIAVMAAAAGITLPELFASAISEAVAQ